MSTRPCQECPAQTPTCHQTAWPASRREDLRRCTRSRRRQGCRLMGSEMMMQYCGHVMESKPLSWLLQLYCSCMSMMATLMLTRRVYALMRPRNTINTCVEMKYVVIIKPDKPTLDHAKKVSFIFNKDLYYIYAPVTSIYDF